MEPSKTGTITETLQTLQDAIWERRPVLGEIMQKHGEKSLQRYAKDFYDINPLPECIVGSRKECVEIVREITERRLGSDVASAVAKQLEGFTLVSTSDHHAIIDNPYWVNANIITSLPWQDTYEDLMPFLVVFSFASVSLNNASGFPRGIEFHGGMNGNGPVVRLPILPDKLKMGTVHGMRAYTADDIKNAVRLLRDREKQGDVTAEKGALVKTFLEGPLSDPAVLGQADLASQITVLNYRLWPELFHDPGSPVAAPGMPGLLYVEIETIVTELLLRRHLKDKKSLINRALFEPAFQQAILKHFDGIPGAFCDADESGTYMFWATDEKFHRIRLMLRDGMLHSRDGIDHFAFTPESLEQLLREKKIFPSTALCYLMIALYYGFKCLGGFCQVHDLTVQKRAWQEVLKDCGIQREVDAIDPLQTKEMNAGGMMLTYVRTAPEHLVIPTGIDMLLERALDTCPALYRAYANKVTLNHSMQPMLPGAYSVFYSLNERTIDTTKLTFEEVLHSTGLYKDYIL